MNSPKNPELQMPAPKFKPLNKEAPIHKTHRNLPHWEQDGCTYFITFRLADALPQEKLTAWQAEREIWLKHHPKPWSEKVIDEYEERFGERMQQWLDTGYGSCALRQPDIRSLVESALRHFDGERYALDRLVIMPNHVHLLVQPAPGHGLPDILHSWKSYTANLINRRLARTGTFWMDENFDHAVRSLRQLERYRCYIAENPRKAGLHAETFTLGCGTGILPVDSLP